MKTKHMHDQMNRRGITQDMVDLAVLVGNDQGDRIVLSRKQVQYLLENVRRIKLALWKLCRVKGRTPGGQGA